MNWSSQEEIKRRAGESPEEALNVSIEGWEKKCEVLEQGGSVTGHSGTDSCGLCERYWQNFGRDCPGCMLNDRSVDGACCQEYQTFSSNPTLANAQAMLNRLYLERGKRYGKAALPYTKECKKEEPREINHAEYGTLDDYGIYFVVKCAYNFEAKKGEILLVSPQGLTSSLANKPVYLDQWHKLGNLVDDLERNSKDLKEFTVSDEDGTLGFEAVKQTGHDTIWIKLHPKSHFFSLEQSESIGKQLLQMVATAKRKAKKDC